MAQVITCSFALMLASSFFLMMAAAAATPGLADFPEEKLLYFGGDPDIGKCLSTLQSVKGCVHEVIVSFLSHRIQLIGKACCIAFTEVDANCWPKVFPFDPFFPPLLKSYCTEITKGDAAPTPPSPPLSLPETPEAPKLSPPKTPEAPKLSPPETPKQNEPAPSLSSSPSLSPSI